MVRVTKSDISLELECWVDELSPAQLAAYEKVANEHNAIKNALKTALNSNEGKELFNGQVFQAYSFKGKVLQELKEATLPKKPPKAAEPPSNAKTDSAAAGKRGAPARKRASNYVYLESSDEEEDDVPLAKRIALAAGKKLEKCDASPASKTKHKSSTSAAGENSGKASPQTVKSKNKDKEKEKSSNFKPSEMG